MSSSSASPPQSPDVQAVYDRILEGSGIGVSQADGKRYLRYGQGPSVLLLHGTRDPSPLWVPVMKVCDNRSLIAPDRPQAQSRNDAVDWIADFLDALEISSTTLVGHSAGGLWALWFALTYPQRVDRLVLIGTPTLPGTSIPLPYRLLATPGLGNLILKMPNNVGTVKRFATMMGEGETIKQYPELIDLMVAVGNDKPSARAGLAEARQLIKSWALLGAGRGFHEMVSPIELQSIDIPTVVLWGDRDPVGTVDVAAQIARLIPNAKSHVVNGGHVPWFGQPQQVAEIIQAR